PPNIPTSEPTCPSPANSTAPSPTGSRAPEATRCTPYSDRSSSRRQPQFSLHRAHGLKSSKFLHRHPPATFHPLRTKTPLKATSPACPATATELTKPATTATSSPKKATPPPSPPPKSKKPSSNSSTAT